MKEMFKLVPMELNVAEPIGLILFGTVVLFVIGMLFFLFVSEIIDSIEFHRKYSDKYHRHLPPTP